MVRVSAPREFQVQVVQGVVRASVLELARELELLVERASVLELVRELLVGVLARVSGLEDVVRPVLVHRA